MSNFASSKTHGMVDANSDRPKSNRSKRNNKQKAAARKEQAVKEWKEMLKEK
jgi:hypothetical protein